MSRAAETDTFSAAYHRSALASSDPNATPSRDPARYRQPNLPYNFGQPASRPSGPGTWPRHGDPAFANPRFPAQAPYGDGPSVPFVHSGSVPGSGHSASAYRPGSGAWHVAQGMLSSEPSNGQQPLSSLAPAHVAPPEHPWRTMLPAGKLAPAQQKVAAPTYGAPQQRWGASCRYTSWDGEGRNATKDEGELECIADEDEEDEYGVCDMSRMVKRMTMAADTQGLANPFSWKELEQSCRQLDQAHIRIDQIDLTCVDSDGSQGMLAPQVLYNFSLDSSVGAPLEELPVGLPVPMGRTMPMEGLVVRSKALAPHVGPAILAADLKDGESANSSTLGSFVSSTTGASRQGSFSLSHQGSTEIPAESQGKASELAGQAVPVSFVNASCEPLQTYGAALGGHSNATGQDERQLPYRMQTRTKGVSAMLKNVKEKCGLLFTSNRAGRRKAMQ